MLVRFFSERNWWVLRNAWFPNISSARSPTRCSWIRWRPNTERCTSERPSRSTSKRESVFITLPRDRAAGQRLPCRTSGSLCGNTTWHLLSIKAYVLLEDFMLVVKTWASMSFLVIVSSSHAGRRATRGATRRRRSLKPTSGQPTRWRRWRWISAPGKSSRSSSVRGHVRWRRATWCRSASKMQDEDRRPSKTKVKEVTINLHDEYSSIWSTSRSKAP